MWCHSRSWDSVLEKKKANWAQASITVYSFAADKIWLSQALAGQTPLPWWAVTLNYGAKINPSSLVTLVRVSITTIGKVNCFWNRKLLAQGGIKLGMQPKVSLNSWLTYLSLLPKFWEYRPTPLYLALYFAYNDIAIYSTITYFKVHNSLVI